MSVNYLSRDELADDLTLAFGEQAASELFDKITETLERDPFIAVYRNEDFGSAYLGHLRVFPAGWFDLTDPVDLPATLPDTPTEINWRYQLVGVFAARSVPCAECGHDAEDHSDPNDPPWEQGCVGNAPDPCGCSGFQR